MSILFQPVAIGTGWYGMNWSNMPELESENGYYLFAGLVWAVAIIIFSKFYLAGVWYSIQGWLHAKKPAVKSDGDDGGVLPWAVVPRSFFLRANSLLSIGKQSSCLPVKPLSGL
jgi:hypothetical protein